jgi:hypothetical protein
MTDLEAWFAQLRQPLVDFEEALNAHMFPALLKLARLAEALGCR